VDGKNGAMTMFFVSLYKFMLMTVVQQVEALLPMLSVEEKTHILRQVQKDLHIAPGIEKTLGVCGGRACIVRTRIPVWSLVEARQMGVSTEDLLADFPALSVNDLENAWNYYLLFKEEIDADILDNQLV
jgi:uncharacterized protein (DUF433 family)